MSYLTGPRKGCKLTPVAVWTDRLCAEPMGVVDVHNENLAALARRNAVTEGGVAG